MTGKNQIIPTNKMGATLNTARLATAALSGLILAVSAREARSQTTSPYQSVPSADQFLRYYPEKAMNLSVEGRATLVCTITADGGVSDCSVSAEMPLGYGFGDAAIKLAPLFKMNTTTSSAGAQVAIPIAFKLADSDSGGSPIMTTRVGWARQPSGTDMEKVRPTSASEQGSATLQCHVQAGPNVLASERGSLSGCKALKASSTKASAAALTLVPLYVLDAKTVAAASPDAVVQFDLSWWVKASSHR
jgi:TonB family protein